MSGVFSALKRRSTGDGSKIPQQQKGRKSPPVEIYAFEKFSVMDSIVSKQMEFKSIPERWRNDYDIIIAAIALKGSDIQYCGEQFRNDKTIALLAVSKEGYSLKFLSPEFQNDVDMKMSDNKQTIGILGAMPEEIQLIQSEAQNVVEHKLNDFTTIYEGILENKKIVFGVSGVGKTFASSVVTTMIHKFHITTLIFTGLAGGMSEDNELGEIVIGKDVIDYDMDCRNFILPFDSEYKHKLGEIPFTKLRAFACDQKLIEIAMKSDTKVTKKIGRIATGSEFVVQSRKQEIFDKSWKELEFPLCVEMEGSAVAQICQVYNIPFLLLRTISDTFKGDANLEFGKFLKVAAEHNNSMALFIVKNL
eukprot:gene11951-5352_t